MSIYGSTPTRGKFRWQLKMVRKECIYKLNELNGFTYIYECFMENQNFNTFRFKEIDICKGILTVLVVIGHVLLQTEMGDVSLTSINRIIGGGYLLIPHASVFLN